MRAVRFVDHHSPLELFQPDIDIPLPGPGEVAIRVRHCGICGSDLHLATEPQFKVQPGSVLGHEYSGEIVACGESVESLRAGMKVAVIPVASCGRCGACLAGRPADCAQKRLVSGGFADYAVVSAAQCVPLPDHFPTEHGALVEPLSVGLHGVAKAGLEPGARVIVIGAGPIGLVTAYWARRFGAARIAVTASSSRKADLALQLGADAFLAPDRLDATSVADALGGPPDVVFECAGKAGLIDKGIQLIRRGGTVVGLGLITEPDTLDSLGAMRKEARIQMAGYFTVGEFRASVAALAQDGATVARMITGRIPLDALPETFEELKRGKNHCKVMVEMA